MAHAGDQPIDGQRLVLKRTPTKAKLVFISKDPDFLFPAIGSADDPATGNPGGATIELFSTNEGHVTLAAAPGAGNPGWTVKSAGTPRYKFQNSAAGPGVYSVRVAILKQGKVLKVTAKDAGVALAGPQGAVGIRITTGTLRNCARFDAPTIRKDQAGSFIAAHAMSATLTDCSDASMSGVTSSCETSEFPICGGACPGDGTCTADFGGCRCVSPSMPCGGTDPVCNGVCDPGEECAAVGPPPFPGCVCIPAGSTPCGDPGAPVCGGVCPSGTECRPFYGLPAFGGQLGCGCASPGPCGQGGVECPNGFACALIPPGTYLCAPVACGGNPTYPTCGGMCVSGATCQAVKLPEFSYTQCVCAIPGPCDTGCGGLTCGAGEVCNLDTATTTCGCGAP